MIFIDGESYFMENSKRVSFSSRLLSGLAM
jgi:hypothetical protein